MPKLSPSLKKYEKLLLTNVILSGNPCPTCVAAEGVTMTLKQWQASRYGIPGSHKRICDGFCHCILVTAAMMQELIDQGLGKRLKLRGDPGSDIGKIIDIGPNEQKLSDLMERYNAELGRLPDEFYATKFKDKVKWLEDALKGGPTSKGNILTGRAITKAERDALEDWGSGSYANIKDYLLNKNNEKWLVEFKADLGTTAFNRIKKTADIIEDLFLKYVDGLRDEVLYRGLSNIKEDLYNLIKNKKSGQILKLDKTISSWTPDKAIAEEFIGGQRSIMFELKSGRKLTSELNISQFTGLSENEILLNTKKFNIVSISESSETRYVKSLGKNVEKSKLRVILEEIK